MAEVLLVLTVVKLVLEITASLLVIRKNWSR